MAVLALAGIFYFVLWFPGGRSRPLSSLAPAKMAVDYELKIATLTSENSDLKKLAAALKKNRPDPDLAARLGQSEAENVKLRRRLEVMMQDNLDKDQTIADLSSGRKPSTRD